MKDLLVVLKHPTHPDPITVSAREVIVAILGCAGDVIKESHPIIQGPIAQGMVRLEEALYWINAALTMANRLEPDEAGPVDVN